MTDPAPAASRRLAAILIADVVGYTALMSRDEAGTLDALRRLREEVSDPAIARWNGRVVKLMGDGALVEFPSVVDAVNAAAEVQRTLSDGDNPLRLRIGVTLGDIVVDGDDIYGDGVNMAARLQDAADPGGVCVSQSVVDHVGGRADVGFRDMGARALKNVSGPVRIYALTAAGDGAVGGAGAAAARPANRKRGVRLALAAGAALLLAAGAAGFLSTVDAPAEADSFDATAILAMPTGPTIAVLPFRSAGEDRAATFASGLSEDIVSDLSRYRELHTLALANTEGLTGAGRNPRAVATKLNATYVIDGLVRMADDRVRVTASLIDGASGASLWSETYDAALSVSTLFDAQSEITTQLIQALAEPDVGAVRTHVSMTARRKPPEDMLAYECTHESLTDWTDEAALIRKFPCIRRAVEEHPDFAEAWQALSTIYSLEAVYGYRISEAPRDDLLTLALEAAQRGAQLAPNLATSYERLASAHRQLGDRAAFWAAAERALELGPGTILMGNIGFELALSGRWELGLKLVRKAMALEPLAYPRRWHMVPAKDLFRKGAYAEAVPEFLKATTAGHWLSDLQLAYTYGAMGDEAKATDAAARLQRKRPGFTIADAVAFYRVWLFEQSYIDKMVAGLRAAGLPEGEMAAAGG